MRPTDDGRDTRNARGRATVGAIEREAVRLALAGGVAALTVDQICAAVGISQRSFFNHFDTKEDALLGWDLPRLDEQRVAAYLADPDVGVLTGAMNLVAMPREFLDDPRLMAARWQLLSSTPTLGERQVARLRPIAQLVEGVVHRKLAALVASGIVTELDDAALHRAAATITTIAGALVAQPPGLAPGPPRRPDPLRTAEALHGLRGVWDRML